MVLARAMLLYLRALRAAQKLHDSMLFRVIRAPISFFDTTPIGITFSFDFLGRVLNRFSKDQQTIDEELPEVLAEVLGMLYLCLSVLFTILLVTPFFLAILVPLCMKFQ